MKYVNYEELLANIFNKNWTGWKNFYEVITEVEEKGSKSKIHKDSKILHGIEFLNNYLLEKRVKEILGLDFLGDDHEVLYAKRGDCIPDFINKETGKTYELKTRWHFEDAMKLNWYDADYCLFYHKFTNTLYQYFPNDKSFAPIKYLRCYYINTKKYPYTDSDLNGQNS